jgi:hypothetical protein
MNIYQEIKDAFPFLWYGSPEPAKIAYTPEFIGRESPQELTPKDVLCIIILVGALAIGVYWMVYGAGELFRLMHHWIFTF